MPQTIIQKKITATYTEEIIKLREEWAFLKHPPPQEGGVRVKFNARLYKLCDVTQTDQSFTVDIGVYVRWHDDRLKDVPPESLKKLLEDCEFEDIPIWKPKFVAEGTLEEPFVHDLALQLKEQNGTVGTVEIYKRMNAKFDVGYLDLHEFPFDEKTFALVWRVPRHEQQGIGMVVCQSDGPLKIPEDFIHHDEYSIVELKMFVQYAGKVATETSCCMTKANKKPEFVVEIKAERQPYFWLFVIILPNLCLTIIGLNTFLIVVDADDPTWFQDRMDFVVTIILTVVAYKFSVNDRLPVLPYLTRLDKWLQAMFAFFIVAAFECTAVRFLQKSGVPQNVINIVDYVALCIGVVWITYFTLRQIWWPWRTLLARLKDRGLTPDFAEHEHKSPHAAACIGSAMAPEPPHSEVQRAKDSPGKPFHLGKIDADEEEETPLLDEMIRDSLQKKLPSIGGAEAADHSAREIYMMKPATLAQRTGHSLVEDPTGGSYGSMSVSASGK